MYFWMILCHVDECIVEAEQALAFKYIAWNKLHLAIEYA